MLRYSAGTGHKKHARLPRRLWWLLLVVVLVLVAGVLVSRHIYYTDLQPVSMSQKTQIFTVDSGSSVRGIADKLEKDHLIRSSWALELYVHSKELTDSIQAGTYALAPNESTPDIVAIMTKGRVSTQLVTILPGRRIDQVRADLINDGFSPSDVDQALNPAQYSDLPVMAFKPANVNTLEGLLWPDSWYKDGTTPSSYIIRESLTAMGDHLTPEIQAAFAAEGLTTYQGLILTSIVEQEVSKPSDQAQVAQVFLSRLKNNTMLQSDATAFYGAAIAGQRQSTTYDSSYNTYLHAGLPPTPISTVSANALAASAHPAATNWLYFVSGDNGNTYFSTTLQEHQAQTQQYCHKLCSGQ